MQLSAVSVRLDLVPPIAGSRGSVPGAWDRMGLCKPESRSYVRQGYARPIGVMNATRRHTCGFNRSHSVCSRGKAESTGRLDVGLKAGRGPRRMLGVTWVAPGTR